MNPRNPIMAAALAASLVLSALGNSYASDTPPAQPVCPPPATETNAVNVLTALIACERDPAGPIKRDIGNRLIAFMLSTDSAGAPHFLTAELFATIPVSKRDTLEHIAAVVPPASGTDEIAAFYQAARNWVIAPPNAQGRPQGGTPAEVAELYLVLNDPNPPAWFTGNAVLNSARRAAEQRAGENRCDRATLIPGLRGDGPRPAGAPERVTERRWLNGIGGANKIQDTSFFFLAATTIAHSLLADARTCAQVRTSITNNEDRPVVPVGPGGTRRVTTGPLSPNGNYNYNDMYNDGGVGGSLVGEGRLPNGSRGQVRAPYYMKLETVRDATTGDLSTYVAVYDNSENPGYVRRVPLTARGDNPVLHATGRWPLVLNITASEGGDLSINLHRAGEDSTSGIGTTASELGRARYDQVVRKATLPDGSLRAVMVGGQPFIVGYQGGADGTSLLYPANLDSSDWRQLRPRMAAVTSRIGGDGDFTPVSGRPNLGTFNGAPYHLEMENGQWVVKDGVGDQPPAPSTTATGPGGPTAPGGPVDRPAGAGQQAGWTDDAEANAGLDAQTRLAYRIQRQNSPADGQLEYNVLTPPNFVPDSARSYRGVTNMRGLGHYLVYEAGTGVAYQDLLVAANQVNQAGRQQADFATVMQVADRGLPSVQFFAVAGSAGRTDLRWIPITDKLVFMDGLKRYQNYTDAQIAIATSNLRALVGSDTGRYVINMSSGGRILATAQNGPRKWIYPQLRDESAAPSDNPGTRPGETGQLLSSQDLTFSADGPFEAQLTVTDNVVAARVIPVGTTPTGPEVSAALYRVSGTTPPNAPSWYLMFKFREARAAEPGGSGTTNIAKTLPIPMFQGHNPPSVANIHIKGYPTFPDVGVSLASGARVAKVDGTGQAKGAWVFLKGASGPSEGNCVGPIIWWGMSETEARTYCTRGGTIPQ